MNVYELLTAPQMPPLLPLPRLARPLMEEIMSPVVVTIEMRKKSLSPMRLVFRAAPPSH